MIDKALANRITCETGQKIISIEPIGKENTKRLYKIKLADKKEYIFKLLQMTNTRLAEYKEITSKRVDGFQEVSYIFGDEPNIYTLALWEEGRILSNSLWEESYENYASYLNVAAKNIRKVHDTFVGRTQKHIDESIINQKLNLEFVDNKIQLLFKNYINENIDLLNSRAWTILHGDLHIDNMLLVKKESNIDVHFIDLDDVFWGDPYRDLVYAANLHKSAYEDLRYYLFLQAYFDGNVPIEFWKIVNCYSIIKAFDIMAEEILLTHDHKIIFNLQAFIDEHDGMKEDVPRWYILAKERVERL